MHGSKFCILKLVFLNWTGPAAEGKAVGPSLKLEVGFRRKNPEHAMHPLQGAADLQAAASAADLQCHCRSLLKKLLFLGRTLLLRLWPTGLANAGLAQHLVLGVFADLI